MASEWAQRAGIAPHQCAIGINPDGPMASVLLGLRLGTCQLEIPCVVADIEAIATVTHDALRGRDLRLVIRPRVPGQYQRWPLRPATLAEVRHVEAASGAACLLDEVFIGQLRTDDDLDPYMIGSTMLVELGDRNVTSHCWTAHLLGAFLPADRWTGVLGDANVKLEAYEVDPRSGHLTDPEQRPRLRAIRSLIDAATWRRDYIAGDYAQLIRVELEFIQPVTGPEAEGYLLDNVCRLLHLFSGSRPTLCGLWDPHEALGRLLDLGRRLVGERQALIDRNTVTVGTFMDEVAPVWGALPEADRKVVKVAMDALTAMPPDVEPAVVAGAMTLEFLADALLPRATNSYGLTKPQRAQVLAGLASLAGQVAPGSAWERDLKRTAPRLFQVPAGDRISDLTKAYGIQTSSAERKAYSAVRNSITHGRPAEATFGEKVTTTAFARHAGWSVVLRTVGFTGVVADARKRRRVPPRPGSRVT
jgi:hypothetical protein